MWNREAKPAAQPAGPAPASVLPVQPIQPAPVAPAPAVAPARAVPPAAAVTYAPPAKASGTTLTIVGELSAAEDLVLEGTVNGRISLPDHVLTIGSGAQISADVVARIVVLHGSLTGNVSTSERTEIKATGRMLGDLVSPRVLMVDGATFNGRLETLSPGKTASAARTKEKELVAV